VVHARPSTKDGSVADLQAVTQNLSAMAAGIERAQQAVAGTDARAEDIGMRAMMSGFAGIASGVQQVRTSISEIRQRLMKVGRSVSEAATSVAGAGGRPTPEETIALLNPADEQVRSVRAELAGLVEHVTQIQQQAGAVLHGGQPGAMISALEQVKQHLAEVIGQSDRTRQSLDEAIAEARRLGEQGN
jgi:ABC-type transporter Mla subunit MlaD